jgi:murein DD-endopeptidase MepM/ murein hydrolase activator NlpD
MGNNVKNILQGLFNKRRAIPRLISLLVWIAMIIMWWVIISLTIDMPMEYKLRHSTDGLRSEYLLMSERYDSLNNVLDNVVKRDENVFRKLFESNPYDLNADLDKDRIKLYEQLVDMDNDELSEILDDYMQNAVKEESDLLSSYNDLIYNISTGVLSVDYVPAIQPVNNKQLTLLAAGKKPLINPFHRAMREHHGVDYLVPEGTPVFATADGVVKSLSEKNTSHGKAVTINHGNGYETSYSHLLDIRVKKGQNVKRGDIIALSGNSGLSFVPHLHYEVIYNDTRVDPVHYFFMELEPDEYQQIIRIALSSMQSFD